MSTSRTAKLRMTTSASHAIRIRIARRRCRCRLTLPPPPPPPPRCRRRHSWICARAHASYLWMKKVEIWTRLRVTVKTSENRSTLCTPNNKLKTVPKDEKYQFRSIGTNRRGPPRGSILDDKCPKQTNSQAEDWQQRRPSAGGIFLVASQTSHGTRRTSLVKRLTSHVTRLTSQIARRRISHVTRHTSHVTRHTSHVTHKSFIRITPHSTCCTPRWNRPSGRILTPPPPKFGV